jgi:hypothetical protein
VELTDNVAQVVDDFSSKLDVAEELETVESLDANHMQMARCRDRSDPQYRAVIGVLRQFLRRMALGENGNRSQEVPPAASDDVQTGPASERSGTHDSQYQKKQKKNSIVTLCTSANRTLLILKIAPESIIYSKIQPHRVPVQVAVIFHPKLYCSVAFS